MVLAGFWKVGYIERMLKIQRKRCWQAGVVEAIKK